MSWIKCKECGHLFDLDMIAPFCPHCKTNNGSSTDPLTEAKDKIAQEMGYSDYRAFFDWVCRDGENPGVAGQQIEDVISRAFRLTLQ